MQVGTQWGLTDTLGNIKVSPQYDEVIDFDIDTIMGEPTRSYYLMRKGNTLHYIDSNNKRYFTNFEIVQNSDKNILYKKNNRVGFTRPSFVNGEWQIDENPDSYPYDKITRLKDKLFSYSIVKTANKVGLLEYETKIVIPLQYDSLDYSVQGETATFTAYRLKEKKIISTERFPIDPRLPPPPSTKSKITWEELLNMEKIPDGEGSALLKRYKIFRE